MKTKLIFNIKNNYSNIYFENYDDNGNLTDSGYRFFDVNVFTGSDEYELSSNDGVYIDGIGTYTKDDDGNKVYHTSEWSFSSCILDETCSNNSFYVNDTEIKLSSFDKDGKYTYDDDNVTYTIDIVNNSISFKSKDGSTTVSSCKLPLNYKTIQFVFSKQKEPTIEYELIKEKLSILDNKITEGFTTVETTQNDIINNQNTMLDNQNVTLKDLDSVLSNQDNMINNQSTIIDKTKTIIDNQSSNLNTLETDLDNKTQEIKDFFIQNRIDITDIDGNFGSLYKDGDKVVVKGLDGIVWDVIGVTLYKDYRNHLSIIYKISTDNGTRQMFIDETMLKPYKE